MKPVIVGGIEIPVVITDDEDEPDLEQCDALFDTERYVISIKDSLPQSVRGACLIHEVGHAGNKIFAVEPQLRRLGLTEKQAIAVEELIAELMGSVFCDTLIRNGWLTLPTVR